MSRLAATGTAAITACLALPVGAAWATSAVDAPWWLATAVTWVVTVAVGVVSVRAVRRAGEHDRAEIRAAAARERAEIRRLHQGEQ